MATLPPIRPEWSQQAGLPSSYQSGNAGLSPKTTVRITQVAANSLSQLNPVTANQTASLTSRLADGNMKTTKVTNTANGVTETIILMRLNGTRKTTEVTKIKIPNGDFETRTEIREIEEDGLIRNTIEIKTEKADSEIQLNKKVTEQKLDGSTTTTETTHSTKKEGGITTNNLILNMKINNIHEGRIEEKVINWKDQYSTTRRIETETRRNENGVLNTTRREIITETLPSGHIEMKEQVTTYEGKNIVDSRNSVRSNLTEGEKQLLKGKQGLREEEMKSAALEKTPLSPDFQKRWESLELKEGGFDWTRHTITRLPPLVPKWNPPIPEWN